MKEGWLCPRCRRINAPFTMYCDCKETHDDNIKVNDATAIDISECKRGNHDWELDAGISSAINYRCRRCGIVKYDTL